MILQPDTRFSESVAVDPGATSIQLDIKPEEDPIVGSIQVSKNGLWFEDLKDTSPVTLPCKLPKRVLEYKFFRLAVQEPLHQLREITVVTDEQPHVKQQQKVRPPTKP